jgi:hypothetical protein
MLRDARTIADIYLENTMTTQIGSGGLPSTASPAAADGAAAGLTPGRVAAANNEAGEEPKKVEKQLPAKHWVKVERIVKDDLKDVENLAHEIAMLVHSCCNDENVTSKVMSKIFKKHRAWSKKK